MAKVIFDANFPRDDDGRVYHLGCKRGDVANRILTVGHEKRAELIAEMLDKDQPVKFLHSKRGFHIYTGYYNKVPLSIISIGMGRAMMDFLVREARVIVDGPMLFMRLGTAGTPLVDVPVGSIAISTGSVEVNQMASLFGSEPMNDIRNNFKSELYYYISKKPVPADPKLSQMLHHKLKDQLNEDNGMVVTGINATADTFYASQGRLGSYFNDHNDDLMQNLMEKHPNFVSLEMETFQLLHLANQAIPENSIRAAASVIIIANRASNEFLPPELLQRRERQAGLACLQALTSFELEGPQVLSWETQQEREKEIVTLSTATPELISSSEDL